MLTFDFEQLIKTRADRKRMAVCIFSAVISNWSGNGVITYYLTLVLDSVGIHDSFSQTLVNGLLQIFNFFAAIFGALLVDRAGRRPLWIVSCAGMLVTYIILTVLSAEFVRSGSSGLGIGVIVMLFLYFFHYDIAVTPLTFGKHRTGYSSLSTLTAHKLKPIPRRSSPSMLVRRAWLWSCSSTLRVP